MSDDDKQTTELDRLRTENELLQLQLQEVQSELEHFYLRYASICSAVGSESRDLDSSIIDERRARKRAERIRDAILASTSWRIGAPLRWIKSRLVGEETQQGVSSSSESPSFEQEHRARLKAERHVEELLASRSWKSTAPLRWRLSGNNRKLEYFLRDQKIIDLERRLDRTRHQHLKLKEVLVRTVGERVQLERTLANAQAVRDKFQHKLTRVWADLRRARESIGIVSSERDELQRKLQSVSTEHKRHRGQLESIATEHERQRRQLERVSTERDRLQRQLDRVSAERDKAKCDYDDIIEAHRNLKEAVEHELAERNQIQQDLDAVSAARDAVKRELENLSAERAHLRTSLDKASAAREKLEQTLSLRDCDLAELQQRYAAAVQLCAEQHETLLTLRARSDSAV